MWLSISEASKTFNKTPATIRRWCLGSGLVPPGFKSKASGKRSFVVWVDDRESVPISNEDALAELSKSISLLVSNINPKIEILNQSVIDLEKKITVLLEKE